MKLYAYAVVSGLLLFWFIPSVLRAMPADQRGAAVVFGGLLNILFWGFRHGKQ